MRRCAPLARPPMPRLGNLPQMADSEADGLTALLALQDEDVRAAQLRHQMRHLPEAAELAELEGQIARLDVELAGVSAQREELVGRRDGLEHDAEEVGRRIEVIEQRAATGGSFRDQEAMASEIESLRRRRRQLEDDELEVMEAIEPVESNLGRLESSRHELMREADGCRKRLSQSAGVLQGELDALQQRRGTLADAVPSALRAEYERLAPRLGGVAAARLVHGMCDGCRLQLPATEIDRIRHATPGTIFHCEQCGRILVPSSPRVTREED